MSSPNASPPDATRPAPPRPLGRRAGWWVLAAALAAAPLASAALWAWSRQEGSLGTTLTLLSQVLPGPQTLSSRQVQGSLRHGGQVGQLQWQSKGLKVHASDMALALDWSQLWQRQLPLTRLDIGRLTIDDHSPASPPVAMTSLQLPLKVQLPLHIGQLHWAGPPALDITGLQGDYVFDGKQHSLNLAPFDIAQGRYTAQARLQAVAPMALEVQLHGQVQTAASPRTRPLTLDADGSVEGSLSGPDAALSVAVHISPAGAAATGMQLDLMASLRPWKSQPVQNATGHWQQLDLASLWPGAPHTRLKGQGTVSPDATGWQLATQLRNAEPGPWNSDRLPLSQLDARLAYQQGLWQVQQLDAAMANGRVKGQGEQTASGWTGVLDLSGLQPAQLHSALSGTPLQGQIRAHTTENNAIAIKADITAATPTAAGLGGLRWDQLHLQGQWQEAEWDIQALDLRAADARLQGHFKFKPASANAQGQLQLHLPGLTAQAEGHLAPQTGQGTASLEWQNAALSQAWLQRWPGMTERLRGLQATGPGRLQAQWQGGYQQAITAVQGSLDMPHLSWGTASATALQIDQGRMHVQGSLQALQAEAEARIGQGRASAHVQTRLSAQRADPATGSWQGQLHSAIVDAVLPMAAPAAPFNGQARLSDAVNWQWHSTPMATTLRWEAGAVRLQGPTPAPATRQARLSWSAGEWSATPAVTSSRGAARLDDLPLTWLPGLIGPEFQSDVLLRGDVNWTLQDQPHLQATLERSSGDLRIAADNASGQRLNAGLRTARLQLQVDGADVQTRLVWDSEQMGQAQAQAQTRLNLGPQGWTWPGQAPLSGQLQASLPRVGAWSLLAPPGWRVQGTLDARMNLSGTRDQPQWQGQLQADNLAVRSAVQGIEFSQGQLRARLQGQQVELEQFSLRGAGAQGGELLATGQLNWHPRTDNSTGQPPWGEVDMRLQLQAKALRVSNRADRRLAISGDVTARMQQGQLQLRGLVQADQALFILPEDSTPTLGSDVVVTSTGTMPPVSQPPANSGHVTAGPSWIGAPDVQIKLDLGPDFQVKGLGLNSRLTGQVSLTSNAATKGQPRLSGEVRTDGGRYKAYGQQLSIDTGVLRFTGPYDNPNLDIVAIRPNLSQRVGVQITGTALLPRIRLYADPDMPDADKLAWLVLGRPAAGGGAESAVLQQAALALLGGNGKTISGELASSLGLDEISLASGSRSDVTATGTAVTLGKRLSRDFYLIYETSLQGTFGSFYVFYDLSRRLTLRAQAGQVNALDLIYTIRRD